MNDHAGIRYLALGDSYTIGEGIAENGRWPVQLAHALREEGIAIDDPHIIATTGWTTDELSAAIDEAGLHGAFGFVSLLIGVNNQYRGRSVDEYRGEFSALLKRAVAFGNNDPAHVLVLSIPDWGVTPFAIQSGRDRDLIASELDAYNAAARDVCVEQDITFIDITQVSRERGAEPTMLADDGLHPSALMYAEWARLALPFARTALS